MIGSRYESGYILFRIEFKNKPAEYFNFQIRNSKKNFIIF